MIAALVPGWLGLSTLVFYGWLLAGRPGLVLLGVLQVLVLAPAVALAWRHVRAPSGDPGPWPPLGLALLGAASLAAAVVGASVLRAYPDGMWMAVDIWNARAAFLAETDLAAMLEGAAWHLDYPLLLPLSIGEVWAFLGRSRAVPMIVSILFTACAAGILHVATAHLADRAAATWVTVVLLASPWFVVHGAGQQADVPLACFALGATALLWLHDGSAERRPGLLLWAGVLLGGAIWTKNEGLVLALAIVAVRTAVRRDGLLLVLAGVAPFALALLHHRLTCGELNDLAAGQGAETLDRLLDPARWAMTVAAYARHAGAYAAVAAVLAWLLPVEPRHLVRGLAVPALVLAAYFGVYLVTPNDLDWQLESSLPRLLLHVWPIVLLALGAASVRAEPSTADG